MTRASAQVARPMCVERRTDGGFSTRLLLEAGFYHVGFALLP